MNFDKVAPSAMQETATSAPLPPIHEPALLRELSIDEVLYVAGGPESEVGSGMSPP